MLIHLFPSCLFSTFLMFSGGGERVHWGQMGKYLCHYLNLGEIHTFFQKQLKQKMF